jgi:trimeric autotransporter adhesin
VGDNQESPTQIRHEFWDPWNTAKIEHSNIDFSSSVISTHDRIRVNSIAEVSNVTIVYPSSNKLYMLEDGLKIEALATSPTAAVRTVQFVANDVLIGEINEKPFEFSLDNLDEGEYSLKAIAIFTDNSRVESNTVMITLKSRRRTQYIFLQQGWNTISTYIEPGIADISKLLAGISENLSMVSNNTGNVYWPSLDIDEINKWDYCEGYQLYMENSDTLIISGSQVTVESNPIELSAGWNLTGYLLDQPYPIEKVLAGIGHTVQIVTNNNGEIYWPETGINSIGDMIPGQGYKIFVGSDAKLHYPSLTIENQQFYAGDNILSHNKTNTENKMHYLVNQVNTGNTSVVLVEIEGPFFGNEVGIWTESGNLVGSGHVINGKAALTVWGRNVLLPDNDFGAKMQEPLRLTLWSAGMEKEYPLKIIALNTIDGQVRGQQNLLFEPDAIFIAKVEIEETIPQRYTLEQNFPNPFNPSTTIRYEIPRDVKVTIEVYNILGQKIRTLVDEEHSAGVYQIVFTGEMLASGVYFYRLQAGNYTEIKKMVLLR